MFFIVNFFQKVILAIASSNLSSSRKSAPSLFNIAIYKWNWDDFHESHPLNFHLIVE